MEEEALAAAKGSLPDDNALIAAKKHGFSDKYLSQILEVPEDDVRSRRILLGVEEAWEGVHVSGTKDSAYYSSTYNAKDSNPVSETKQKIMILGGGPNRIGQGIEFDYCCVHASQALKKLGFETIIVNCNPETVSTDYDTSDKLYFEPLTLEDVLSIYKKAQPAGVIAQFGGQTPLNLAADLEKNGVKPLVPYGFGLSYTTFDIFDPKAAVEGDCLKVTARVKNTGDRDGDEVVQLYVGFQNSAVDRPVKQLRGFTRVSLQAGEEKTVEIVTPVEKLKWYNPVYREWQLEHMDYPIYVGSSSAQEDLTETVISL